MRYIGECDVQYVSCLAASKGKVLRADRDKSDNPIVEFFTDDVNELFLIFKSELSIENMTSNPKQGSKIRLDIHFNENHLDNIEGILRPYVDSLSGPFDDRPRSTPNPTGLEHPNGLPLGKTTPITSIPTNAIVNFYDAHFSLKSNGVMYIDAERYSRGKKYHFGFNFNIDVNDAEYDVNCVIISIEFRQLKRLLHSIYVAKMWLK